MARRRRLVELAQEYDVVILEDTPYRELWYDGERLPTIKSLDTTGRVVHLGSFSKILAPGLRLGWSFLEGLGASLIMPAIVALVAANFPAERRAGAYGLVAAAGAMAVAAGPLIGGAVTTFASWRYVFVGEEGPATIGSTSSGDVHVVDVTTMSAPREVAFYHVAGAGTHNFSVDETKGLLYAAFYNAGVRVLDVRGDLGSCDAAARTADGRCDLAAMGRERNVGLLNAGRRVYVWGVQLAGNFSKSLALASFSRARASLSAIIGDIRPMVIGTRLRTRGTRAFYRVRVPATSRQEADALCRRIQAARGACVTLRS